MRPGTWTTGLSALAATTALLLGACSSDSDDEAATSGLPTSGQAFTDDLATDPTEGPTGGISDQTGGPTDEPAGDDDAGTAPAGDGNTDGDAATGTGDDGSSQGEDEVMGGAEGQAAADRAKEFLIALVKADAEACTMLLSFSDPERPMTAIASDLELCQAQLPATMEATVQAQGLGEEGVAVLEAMRISGARISEDGQTAVVGRDNYSELFQDAMGDSTITLKRIDDQWYVDLDAYLATE